MTAPPISSLVSNSADIISRFEDHVVSVGAVYALLHPKYPRKAVNYAQHI